MLTSLSSSLRSQGVSFALHTGEHTHARSRGSAAAPSLALACELRRPRPPRARCFRASRGWLRQWSACQVAPSLRSGLHCPRSFRCRSRSWSPLAGGQFIGRSPLKGLWPPDQNLHAGLTPREPVGASSRVFRCSLRAVKRHAACSVVVISLGRCDCPLRSCILTQAWTVLCLTPHETP